jgi:hypothetical protein
MKKNRTMLFALIIGIIAGNAQTYQWAKSMGGISLDGGNSIALDSSGNVYTTGAFGETVDFDPGSGISNLTSAGGTDIFISKLDAAGNFLWAKRLGGENNDGVTSIASDDSGNVYTTGTFEGTVDFDPGAGTSNLTAINSDIFISKLDAAGNFVWAKKIGGYRSASIAVDESGNVYTTGDFLATVDFDPGTGISNLTSAGGNDIFILKLDAAGNFLWAKRLGGLHSDEGTAIAVDGTGNVYTTGNFDYTTNFDPGSGISNLTSAGNDDIFISKLDSAGNFLWAKRLGGTNYDYAYSIVVDDSGNVYTTGSFEGTADFNPGPGISNLTSAGGTDIFISKLNAAGDFVWAKSMGGIYADAAWSIAIDSDDNVYTTGFFSDTADFDPGAGISNLTAEFSQIFISKIDSAGDFLWAVSMGGDESRSFCIVVDGSGNVYTTGYFFGTADFNPGGATSSLTSQGGIDIFVSKLGASGVGILENHFGNTLKVYPNPTNGEFNIDLGKNYEGVTIIIKNLLGQAILKKSFTGSNVLQLIIPGEAGMYFIEVNSGDKKAIVKVIKE